MVRGKIDLMIAVMPVKNDDNSNDDNENNIVKEEVQLWTSLLWTTSRLQDSPCTKYVDIIIWTTALYKDFQEKRKSRNNTREKIRYFFTCIDIANQMLTRHSRFAPLGQVDERMANLSPFSIRGCFVGMFSDYGCWNTEKSVSLIFLEGEENQNTKRKTGVTYSEMVFACLEHLLTKQGPRRPF